MEDVRDPDAFRRIVLESAEPVVVLFWATWCPFCRRFKPEFDRLGGEVPARFVNVFLDDESNPLWEDYAVDVVPTLAMFCGGELVEREDGILGYGIDRASVRSFADRVIRRLTGGNGSQSR